MVTMISFAIIYYCIHTVEAAGVKIQEAAYFYDIDRAYPYYKTQEDADIATREMLIATLPAIIIGALVGAIYYMISSIRYNRKRLMYDYPEYSKKEINHALYKYYYWKFH